MSMFPSSLAAVRAAVAVQRELTAQDVHVRIGIHTGEVIVEPERLTGEAVNIASRIESFATPGIMLSDSAYEQIRNQAELPPIFYGDLAPAEPTPRRALSFRGRGRPVLAPARRLGAAGA
jgi:class 3 adenylate cyclase